MDHHIFLAHMDNVLQWHNGAAVCEVELLGLSGVFVRYSGLSQVAMRQLRGQAQLLVIAPFTDFLFVQRHFICWWQIVVRRTNKIKSKC